MWGSDFSPWLPTVFLLRCLWCSSSFCAKISPDARGILFTKPMLNVQCTQVWEGTYFGVRVFKPNLDKEMWETEFAIQSPSTSSLPKVLLRTAPEPPLIAVIRELIASGKWHFLLSYWPQREPGWSHCTRRWLLITTSCYVKTRDLLSAVGVLPLVVKTKT